MTVPSGWYKAADSIALYECRDEDQCVQSARVTFENVRRLHPNHNPCCPRPRPLWL